MYISIHAPRAGCDRRKRTNPNRPSCHFNPRTPCGVRRKSWSRPWASWRKISIHAPRAGCDLWMSSRTRGRPPFQSTHPVRGATRAVRPLPSWNGYFNPRTPCGVRPGRGVDYGGGRGHFNPRTPCGVRPRRQHTQANVRHISIHAPRAGCDWRVGGRVRRHI